MNRQRRRFLSWVIVFFLVAYGIYHFAYALFRDHPILPIPIIVASGVMYFVAAGWLVRILRDAKR